MPGTHGWEPTSARAAHQLLPRNSDLHVLGRGQPRSAPLPCPSRRNARFGRLDGRVIAGDIHGAALRNVQEWAMTHRDELAANWERARRAEPIVPIEPKI